MSLIPKAFEPDSIFGRHSLPSLIYHEPVLEVRFMRGAAGTCIS
jgi:hypothetical protein